MKEMTPEGRRRVHPCRGDDAMLPDAADEGRRRLDAEWKTAGAYWKRGLEHTKKPHGERLKAVIEMIDGGADAARDPDTEATLMVMFDYWSRRGFPNHEGHGNERYAPTDEWLVRRWLAAGGLPFALRTLAAFPRIDVDFSHASSKAHTLAIQDRDGYAWWCLEVGHLGICHMVRRFVVAASEAEYKAARAEAVKIRETAPIWLCAALAFVFPDEPFHVQDLAAIRASTKKLLPSTAWGLVTTRLDKQKDLAEILASMAKDDQSWTTETQDYGWSVVHRMGDAAAPLLVGYLEIARGKTARLAFAQALAVLDGPVAREFFERKQPNPELKAVAAGYLDGAGKPAKKPKKR